MLGSNREIMRYAVSASSWLTTC